MQTAPWHRQTERRKRPGSKEEDAQSRFKGRRSLLSTGRRVFFTKTHVVRFRFFKGSNDISQFRSYSPDDYPRLAAGIPERTAHVEAERQQLVGRIRFGACLAVDRLFVNQTAADFPGRCSDVAKRALAARKRDKKNLGKVLEKIVRPDASGGRFDSFPR